MRAARTVFAICVVVGFAGCQATKSAGWFLVEGLFSGADDPESYVDSAGQRQRKEVEAAEAAAKSQAEAPSESR
jgi:hypothetical protein